MLHTYVRPDSARNTSYALKFYKTLVSFNLLKIEESQTELFPTTGVITQFKEAGYEPKSNLLDGFIF
jgi:hypothetical protein